MMRAHGSAIERLFQTAALSLSALFVMAPAARAEDRAFAQEKLDLAQGTLDSARETYGADSAETTVSLMNLARVKKEQGDYQQAVFLYRQSGAMAEKLSDPEDPFLLAIFNGLASTYEVMRKYAAADAVYEEVRYRGYPEWADQMEFRADTMRQV
jgi:tetratricopeptide (TPR) repeat protein